MKLIAYGKNSKQMHKHLHRHAWQTEGDNGCVLRDYKTFYLMIVLDKNKLYACSFSGAKMSAYAHMVGKQYADAYATLLEAQDALTQFCDAYSMQLKVLHRVNVQAHMNAMKLISQSRAKLD